jgi:hypothetical protein
MPSNYTKAIADRIIDLIAEGRSLAAIEQMDGMPARRTVRDWIDRKPDFASRYAAARLQWVDSVAEEINQLADSAPRVAAEAGEFGNAAVQALRVQIDTKRWLLSKIAPSKYGYKLAVEATGKDGKDLLPADATAPDRLALAILAVLQPAKPPGPLLRVIDPPPEPTRLVFDTLSGRLVPRKGDDA